MSRAAGRPQESAETGPSYALARWLNEHMLRLPDITDQQIAATLGYARPNIVSMWRTGRTRVPLNKLCGIADILGVELEQLLPLWLEQYIGDEPDCDRIVAAASRIVSEDDARTLAILRKAAGGRPFKLKRNVERQLAELISAD